VKNIRRFLTVLNFHIAGVVVLLGLVIFLASRALFAIHAAGALQSDSYQQAQISYARLQAQMRHLQGLPQKVDESREDALHFFAKRIAPNYSTVFEELGGAAVKDQVRLTRAQYTPTPAIDALTEVRIDANLGGDYTALMHFINDLERDKNHVFFIIDGLTLTGQQGGLVNLRLRLTTYLSANATDLPPSSDEPATEPPTARAETVSEGGTR
jgi:type IV pilus assembly protein PilO